MLNGCCRDLLGHTRVSVPRPLFSDNMSTCSGQSSFVVLFPSIMHRHVGGASSSSIGKGIIDTFVCIVVDVQRGCFFFGKASLFFFNAYFLYASVSWNCHVVCLRNV